MTYTRRGWSVVCASWMVHFCNLGTIYSVGVYFVPISQAFGKGRGETAWMGSIIMATMLLSSLGHANLARKSLRGTFLLGAILLGSGLAITSVVTSIGGVYASCVVAGAGLGTAILAPMVVQPWFTHTRGLATGVAMSGSGLGNFVFAILLEEIISHYDNGKNCELVQCDGWRFSLRWEALMMTTLLMAATVFIKVPKAAPRPSVVDLRTVKISIDGRGGDLQIDEDRDVMDASGKEDSGTYHRGDIPLRQLASTPCMLWLLLYFFLASFGYSNIFVHIVPSAKDQGVSERLGATLLGTLGLASLFGRLILGFAADRIGRLNMLKLSMLVMTISICCWPWMESFGGFMAVAIFYGFFAGGFPSLPPTILADYYHDVKHMQLRLMGLCAQVQIFGALLGPPITGWLFDAHGDYVAAAFFTAGSLLFGGLALFLIPNRKVHDEILERTLRRHSWLPQETSVESIDVKKECIDLQVYTTEQPTKRIDDEGRLEGCTSEV